jgi:hypothetical protein
MMRLCGLLLCCLTAAQADNLLANAGFEIGRGRGVQADSWTVGGDAPLIVERVAGAAHSGHYALRLTVPADATVSWYSVGQELTAFSTRKLTFSCWIKPLDVRDGHGAYLSINCFDAEGKRLANYDSPGVTGAGDWQRVSCSGAAPGGTTTIRALLLLHGHGQALFDDAQLEYGETPTAWAPSPADQERAQRLASQQAAAVEILRRLGHQRQPGRNVAVLADKLPTRGAATDPDAIVAALTPAGYRVTKLSAEDLANPAVLSAEQFDLLVLPCGDAFPALAHRALVDYLASGGCFLSLGGYAFDRPLVQADGRWFAPDEVPLAPPTFSAIITDFHQPTAIGPTGQVHAAEHGVRAAAGADGGYAFRVQCPALDGWATTGVPVDLARLRPGWATTRLRAKGDRDGQKLIVEWSERDGSRWQKILTLDTTWRDYVIPARDMAYWRDNPSVGRGGPEDALRPAQVAAMTVGWSVAEEKSGSALGADIAWVKVEDDLLAHLRGKPPWINTRYGRIADAMHPSPEQIGAFDPSHPLLEVARAKAAADQTVVPADFAAAGTWTGFAATCVLGLQGHGFSPNRVRLIPLLDTFDAAGRFRGAAMSLAYHYDGFYQGSAWGFCGVDNQDLFGAGQPLNRLLPKLADALLARVFLNEADAEYACYRPGETMTVRCAVSDFGRAAASGDVRLLVDGAAQPLQAVEVAAGQTRALTWRVPVGGQRPFLELRFELVRDGQVVDAIDNGVVVWRDQDVRRGPAVAVRDGLLTFRGQPRFLVGSQLYWGQTASVTARSPLQFKRDFEQMKGLGFHISRSFLACETEQQKRISDAIVALAAANDVVVYHTPNWGPYAPAARLQTYPALARELAERYRGVPNLVIDMCNEPPVSTERPDPLPAWNAWLQQHYADTDALRAAWGARAPAEALGHVALPKPLPQWADQATADLYHFLVDDNRAWSRALQAVVHQVDPSRLVSVGFLPGHGWGENSLVAPYEGSLDLDFSDRHLYGDVSTMPSEIAWIDLRPLGKPLTVGEFGARNHPGFGSDYEDTATYDHRHELIVAHALGQGGSFADSWHWRDPMEGIFPFGQVHADGVPRSVAGKMSAMAQAFGALDRSGALPPLAVLLPIDHCLSGARPRVIAGVSRALDTLLGLHAPFTVIGDLDLDRLPAGVKQLIAPLPYVLSDAAFEQLVAFVERGGSLVVSGDLRYDPLHRPHPERLARLCGLTAGAPHAPLDLSGPATTITWAGVALPAHPAADGPAGVSERALGRGRVLYVPAPIELETAPALRDFYAAELGWLGAERLGVRPDAADLHVFRIDLNGGGRAYLVWNEGPAREVVIDDPAGARHLQVGDRTWGLSTQ